MKPEPLISVIIPAHNSGETVGTAIQSILDQTWKNLEVIVVDDNSTDNSRSVVEAFAKKDRRVSYYALPYDDPHRVNRRGRNINAGYMARNYGFEKVRGEYITFQDADDASMRNRIEVQYGLLMKYEADHVTLDWQMYDEKLIDKAFDAEKYLHDHIDAIYTPTEILKLARKTKGMAYTFPRLASKIDFEWKRARIINKLFFGSLDQYPGTGNSPLFKREIIDKVQFRKLDDRIWPSYPGRGADRDFNFQVAETFRNSYVFFIPMYLWRQTRQNDRYSQGLQTYIID